MQLALLDRTPYNRVDMHLGNFYEMTLRLSRVAALSLLLFRIVGVAGAASKDRAPCKAFFLAVEQDEVTVNLKMVGLNKLQHGWYRKNGNQKDFAGVCLVNPNETGKRGSPGVQLRRVHESHCR